MYRAEHGVRDAAALEADDRAERGVDHLGRGAVDVHGGELELTVAGALLLLWLRHLLDDEQAVEVAAVAHEGDVAVQHADTRARASGKGPRRVHRERQLLGRMSLGPAAH